MERYYVVNAFTDRILNGPFDTMDDALRFLVMPGENPHREEDDKPYNLCIMKVIAGPSPLV